MTTTPSSTPAPARPGRRGTPDRPAPRSQPLLQPLELGALRLPNRVVMAPTTRARADNEALAPTDTHTAYYAQRAGAGLIVTEGTWVGERAIGFVDVPGIYSPEQVRCVAPCHRCGARTRRPDRPSALAHRRRLPSGPPGRSPARGPLRGQPARDELHRRRPPTDRHAKGDEHRGDTGHGRGVRRGRGERAQRRVRRCRGPRTGVLPDPAVPQPAAQHAHRRVRR